LFGDKPWLLLSLLLLLVKDARSLFDTAYDSGGVILFVFVDLLVGFVDVVGVMLFKSLAASTIVSSSEPSSTNKRHQDIFGLPPQRNRLT
jgi:hypothetical protein